MYKLARQPDTDVQAEAATVIANVTSSSWEAQLRVAADDVLQLLLYLCMSESAEVQSAATRAVANLTQNIDNEPLLREARSHELLFKLFNGGTPEVKWQAKRTLANLEATHYLLLTTR